MWPITAAIGKCTNNLYEQERVPAWHSSIFYVHGETECLSSLWYKLSTSFFQESFSTIWQNTANEHMILPPLLVSKEMKYKPTQEPCIKPSVEWHIPAQYYMKGCWQNSDHVWTCCLKKLEIRLNLTMKSNTFSMLAA